MLRKRSHRPFYRELLQRALQHAWRERRLWPLAILAGILQTGGIYDVFVNTLQSAYQGASQAQQRPLGLILHQILSFQPPSQLHANQLLTWLLSLQGPILAGLLIAAILFLSALAQGALTHHLIQTNAKRDASVRDGLAASAKQAKPLILLNICSYLLVWLAQFPVLYPLTQPTQHHFVFDAIFFVAIVALLFVALVVTSLHFYSLNYLMTNGGSFAEAYDHAWRLFKRSWLITIEIAAVLSLIGIGLFFLTAIAGLLAAVPLGFLIISAAVLQIDRLIVLGYGIGFVAIALIVLGLSAFAVNFQYTVWEDLYRRVQERRATAKIHRWFAWLKNQT